MQMPIRTATTAAFMALLCLGAAWSAEPAPSKKAKSPIIKSNPPPAETKTAETKTDDSPQKEKAPAKSGELQEATFGSGCFWCAEAVFQQLKGVKSVVSGYSGGTVANPSYQQVSSGLTGHAECVEITFDPAVISYEELLEVFWKTHDPTKLNEQGPDHGTQYRSVIFYHSDEQREIAEKSKQKHTRPGRNAPKIVTEITKFSEFYPAEDYHQNYFKNNPHENYCQMFIRPKVNKVKKEFKDQLKTPPSKK